MPLSLQAGRRCNITFCTGFDTFPHVTNAFKHTRRPSEAARAAAEGTYEDLVHKCVQMRRVHDSVRLQYHRLMRAATAEEAALLHSHNDSIRFLSWLFALMKVRRPSISAIPTVHRRQLPHQCCMMASGTCSYAGMHGRASSCRYNAEPVPASTATKAHILLYVGGGQSHGSSSDGA